MQFVSSRKTWVETDEKVPFSNAILNCIAPDGGLYVPAYIENLQPWILYMDNKTSFVSLAGSLTSALIHEEFSPIISEAIAVKAFDFSPVIKQLDDRLFVMELFHGPTGCYKDFGISYLASCLEHILLMQEKNAVVLAVTNGETGASIANALRNKKHLKAVLLYTKGTTRGFFASDCINNGGNICPVEVLGTEEDCFDIVRKIFSNKEFVEKYNLTLANTVNIGRLLPLSFCYVYAFSRIKQLISGDMYYAVDAGNYGNLVAGLYGWKTSLPVNGFITNCTDSLVVDQADKCFILDSVVPLSKRNAADPANPSNLERLEEVFVTNPAVLRALIFPAQVTDKDVEQACKLAYRKYGELFDKETSTAYAVALKRNELISEDDGAVILIERNHPGLSEEWIRHICGEKSEMTEEMKAIYTSCEPMYKIKPDLKAVMDIIGNL